MKSHNNLFLLRKFWKRLHHRLRFVFIGVVGGERFTLRQDTTTAQWRTLARDGFEIPRARQRDVPAQVRGWAGQTFDFDFFPTAAGEYTLALTFRMPGLLPAAILSVAATVVWLVLLGAAWRDRSLARREQRATGSC